MAAGFAEAPNGSRTGSVGKRVIPPLTEKSGAGSNPVKGTGNEERPKVRGIPSGRSERLMSCIPRNTSRGCKGKTLPGLLTGQRHPYYAELHGLVPPVVGSGVVRCSRQIRYGTPGDAQRCHQELNGERRPVRLRPSRGFGCGVRFPLTMVAKRIACGRAGTAQEGSNPSQFTAPFRGIRVKRAPGRWNR